MDAWFKLKERGSSLTTEMLAGITTFFTMVYIVVVNPGILSQAGMDFNGVFIAVLKDYLEDDLGQRIVEFKRDKTRIQPFFDVIQHLFKNIDIIDQAQAT